MFNKNILILLLLVPFFAARLSVAIADDTVHDKQTVASKAYVKTRQEKIDATDSSYVYNQSTNPTAAGSVVTTSGTAGTVGQVGIATAPTRDNSGNLTNGGWLPTMSAVEGMLPIVANGATYSSGVLQNGSNVASVQYVESIADNTINGIPLSAASGVFYGGGSGAAGTSTKSVTIGSITSIVDGVVIVVQPATTSTVSFTINLNQSGNKDVFYNGAAVTNANASLLWNSNYPSIFVFSSKLGKSGAWVFAGAGTTLSQDLADLPSHTVNGAPISNAANYYYDAAAGGAADSYAKTASIPSITTLSAGQIIAVQPTTTSAVTSSLNGGTNQITLALNGGTAYPIIYGGQTVGAGNAQAKVWNSGFPSTFVFDGTNWVFLGHGYDTSYTPTSMTTTTGTTGTSDTDMVVSPLVLKNTIQGVTLTSNSGQPTFANAVSNTAITANDTVMQAFGHAQGQINNKQNQIPAGTNGQVVTYSGTAGTVGAATVSSAATYTSGSLQNGSDIANITAVETKQNKIPTTSDGSNSTPNYVYDQSTNPTAAGSVVTTSGTAGTVGQVGITTAPVYSGNTLTNESWLPTMGAVMGAIAQYAPAPTGTANTIANYGADGSLGNGIATYDASGTYTAGTDAGKIATAAAVETKQNKIPTTSDGSNSTPNYVYNQSTNPTAAGSVVTTSGTAGTTGQVGIATALVYDKKGKLENVGWLPTTEALVAMYTNPGDYSAILANTHIASGNLVNLADIYFDRFHTNYNEAVDFVDEYGAQHVPTLKTLIYGLNELKNSVMGWTLDEVKSLNDYSTTFGTEGWPAADEARLVNSNAFVNGLALKQNILPAEWTATTGTSYLASTGGQTIALGGSSGNPDIRYITGGGNQPLTQRNVGGGAVFGVLSYVNGAKTLAQFETSNFGATGSTNEGYIKGALVSLELLKDVYSALHNEIQNATPTGTPGNVAMYDPTTGALGDGVATYDGSGTYNASTDSGKIATAAAVETKQSKIAAGTSGNVVTYTGTAGSVGSATVSSAANYTGTTLNNGADIANITAVETKQNKIAAGTAGQVVTYTGTAGSVGSATVSSAATYTNGTLQNGADIANITAVETKVSKTQSTGYQVLTTGTNGTVTAEYISVPITTSGTGRPTSNNAPTGTAAIWIE